MIKLSINDETQTMEEKPSLFASPLTFLLTHLLFPLITTAACAYIYWITCGSLEGALLIKAKAVVVASALLPLAALGVLLLRPRRMGVWLLAAWSFAGFVFLYLAMPVLGKIGNSVDDWIMGPTPFLAALSGIMPLIFSGIARIATARWPMRTAPDVISIGLCIVGPPAAIFIVMNIIFYMERSVTGYSRFDAMLDAMLSHVLAVGYFVASAVFFVGILRLMHKAGLLARRALPESGDRARRIGAAALFGLVLPLAGLSLNLSIPFPADFANIWTWALAVLTGVVLLVPVRCGASGAWAFFLRFVVAPFVLYFFILFVPFLPLAIFAVLFFGAGFLILAPTLLFQHWARDVGEAYVVLRGRHGRMALVCMAVAGFLVLPAAFCVNVEIERHDVKSLIAWHTCEDFDAPPAPMPVSKWRAKRIMTNVNDYTFGAEIPFLSAWRTWRVYDGMYMADKLRNELNLRILGKRVDEASELGDIWRNGFGSLFGANTARRSYRRGARTVWRARPDPADEFSAMATPAGGEVEALFTVSVTASSTNEFGQYELVEGIKLPAGAWIEGMRLKMADGTWKTARASERKAAEWVYTQITERNLDPSIVTLDSPTAGTLKVFPVDHNGREVELSVRLPATDASPCVMTIGGKAVANPLYTGSEPPGYYSAEGASVTIVPEAWMEASTGRLVRVAASAEPVEFNLNDPELMRKLRRHLRQWSKDMAKTEEPRLPSFTFTSAPSEGDDEFFDGIADALGASDLAILRRELPGIVALGDKPVDGWFAMETEDGGRVMVPYRKGDGGAVVFARLKGAKGVSGAWAEGAKAWELENEGFLKPALDVRRELLHLTRKVGTLTTKSAYIVVETDAQEKGLKVKEMATLHGDQSLDMDESMSEESDAPTFLMLLAGIAAIVFLLRRKGVQIACGA